MLVLLTNDDGLGAPGLHALADALTQYGHEVWIAAPASDQSGVSHGLSLTVPLRIDKPDERVFSCCGKPADCVIAAFDGLLPRLPDAVLSGINNGANLGTDLVFSGTAAAARQAAIHGVPGIAVSLVLDDGNLFVPEAGGPPRWKPLARFAAENLETLAGLCRRDLFLSLNAASLPSYKGGKMTSLCRRVYHDTLRFSPPQNGPAHSAFECVFSGGSIDTVSSAGDDWDAVRAGYVSVSPVLAQPAVCPEVLAARPVWKTGKNPEEVS